MIKLVVNNATAEEEIALIEQVFKLLAGKECRAFSSRAKKEFRVFREGTI